MMTFTSQEILLSVLYAIIYGCFFALLLSALLLIKGVIKGGRESLISVIRFDKIFPLPSFSQIQASENPGAFLSAASIILFAVGFSLLSYFSLDGEIRLYMLILSFASFYLSKFVILGIFKKIFTRLIRLIFIALSFVLRIFILPLRDIVSACAELFKRKMRVKNKKKIFYLTNI